MVCPLMKIENEQHDSIVVKGAKMTEELLVCQGEWHDEEDDQQEVAVGVKDPAYGVMSVAKEAAMDDEETLESLEERQGMQDALISMRRDSRFEDKEELKVVEVVSWREAQEDTKDANQIVVYILPMGGNPILQMVE